MNLAVSTAWNLLPWLGLLFENATAWRKGNLTNPYDAPGTKKLTAALIWRQFLREALFPSGSEEKLMFFSFCFVTRIIDFCERYREGVTRLLDLVGLSLGF